MEKEDAKKGYKGYTIFEDKEGNTVQISKEVIATIAAMCVTDVKGVAFTVDGNIGKELIAKLGWKNLSKGVRVDVTEEGVSVDIAVYVKYDTKIMDVSREIQERIKTTIKDMTNLDVAMVNVHVAGMTREEEN